MKNLCNDDQYCCLGVLCELAVEAGVISKARLVPEEKYAYGNENENENGYALIVLPSKVVQWAGMREDNVSGDYGGISLMAHNDDGRSFTEIADIIDAHVAEL